MDYSEEQLNQIRKREEYKLCCEYIPKMFSYTPNIRHKKHSQGIKNLITNYVAKKEPHRYNYCGADEVNVSMMDNGYKFKKFENNNYYFNVNI